MGRILPPLPPKDLPKFLMSRLSGYKPLHSLNLRRSRIASSGLEAQKRSPCAETLPASAASRVLLWPPQTSPLPALHPASEGPVLRAALLRSPRRPLSSSAARRLWESCCGLRPGHQGSTSLLSYPPPPTSGCQNILLSLAFPVERLRAGGGSAAGATSAQVLALWEGRHLCLLDLPRDAAAARSCKL